MMVQKYVSSGDGVAPLPSALQMLAGWFERSEKPVQNFPTPFELPVSPGWPVLPG